MRLRAEFTTEPFEGEGEPPPHVTATLDALRDTGLDCGFGPFGTSATGDSQTVLDAVATVVRVALSSGATRITLQVERVDG